MRFEVPQFIDIEDKIFGPFTWRQFLYLGGGVGMGVALFFTAPPIVFIIIGLPLAILAGALAFFPVGGRPFSFFLESLINYLRGQKLYLWQRKKDSVYKNNFTPKLPPTNSISFTPAPSTNFAPKNLSSMARRLELEALQKKED